MRESFLHYVWRTRRIALKKLTTTTFQPVEILDPGTYNTDAGPDFFNARIRIGDTIWAGNVEMHVRASEWLAHGHQNDPAYDNVILHVVFLEDKAIYLEAGVRLPCLEIRDRVALPLLEKYMQLEAAEAWIPCASFFPKTPQVIRLNCQDRLLVERLEEKTAQVAKALNATQNHWDETFYRVLAAGFGLKVNVQPFESLARTLPLHILSKHRNHLFQLEALLFGQAGFLQNDLKDAYPQALLREYQHLAHKYQLHPMSVQQWKFARLRPAGFPTIRLAQFAALISQSERLFSQILEVQDARSIENLFALQVSDYWLDHFQFDKPSIRLPKRPGRDFIELLILNCIVPVLYHYGKINQLNGYQNLALKILEELPPESNVILDGWKQLGTRAHNAYESQALLHLKTRYCDAKRCLECAIGNAILK
ncbi:MAG: DUF2851 family protein [Saprospiraceae bacterium]|jgi:hypothetical protein